MSCTFWLVSHISHCTYMYIYILYICIYFYSTANSTTCTCTCMYIHVSSHYINYVYHNYTMYISLFHHCHTLHRGFRLSLPCTSTTVGACVSRRLQTTCTFASCSAFSSVLSTTSTTTPSTGLCSNRRLQRLGVPVAHCRSQEALLKLVCIYRHRYYTSRNYNTGVYISPAVPGRDCAAPCWWGPKAWNSCPEFAPSFFWRCPLDFSCNVYIHAHSVRLEMLHVSVLWLNWGKYCHIEMLFQIDNDGWPKGTS